MRNAKQGNDLKVPMNRKLFLFCFRVYHQKYTFPKLEKSRFEIDDFTSLQRCTILPSKWSGEWVEFNLKWPSRDVTLLPWVYLRCHSFLLASERIWKNTCPAIPKAALLVWCTSNAIPPSLLLFFLVRHIARTIVAPKWRQKLISRGILAARFKYHFWG